MGNENLIRSMLSDKINMTPKGFIADELSPEQFATCYEMFFDQIFEISRSDLSGIQGYGDFNDNGNTDYRTFTDYVVDTFADHKEGYWYNWREMFDTTMLEQHFFDHYYKEMLDRVDYCEGRRYLVYNNAFFENIVVEGMSNIGFPDWSKAGIGDFLVDFAIMDLNKPYLKIPEKLYEYCKRNGIDVAEFKERYLCLAYYKGIDVLRWHASIDDIQSCTTIVKSISELKDRIYSL